MDTNDKDVWADLEAGEQGLTLNAARRLPAVRRDGRTVDLCTIYRWTTRGIPSPSGKTGERITLETFQQSGRRCTTKPAVIRFLRRLSDAPAPRTTTASHDEAYRRAESVLEAAGI
ncbi:MAG TPA: hypothetical protein VFC78_02805 [Tepidisphaeraceae bacterium]|nr:hypothetical protein [Tepidisphaeraceae bacterium]